MRRRILALAFVAALMPALVAAQPAPSITTIRVGASPDAYVTPLLYAMRTGLFRRAGLDVELTKLSSGAAGSAAVAGGALDVGKSSLLALILGHARGVPFTILAPSGLLAGGLLVRTSSSLREAKDFAGATIATAAVLDLDVLAIKTWLDRNGGDSRAIKFAEIPSSAAPAALEAGRVDGAMLVDPAFTVAQASGKARVVADIFSAIAPRLLGAVWYSTTGYVEQNHAAMERFARVIAEASAYANAHPNDMLPDLLAYTGIDPALAARMRPVAFSSTVAASDIEPVIDAAVKYQLLERPFSASELISDAAWSPERRR